MKHFTLSLIGIFAVTFMTSFAEAQQVYGELKVVKGDVNIKSGRDMKVTKAAIGLRVFPTDTIITGKDSRAKILMVDKNEINISPESEIVLQKYVYDPAGGKKEVLLNVLSGKVRAKVEQKYDGKTAKFQVKTPSAVAGVRGTDFLTSFDTKTQQSSVVTFHGHVEFGQPGAGGTIANPVMVDPGRTSSVAAGSAPTAPVEMPKQQLASMDKESQADTASVAPKSESDTRQPTSEEKKKEDSKDGAKTEDKKSDTKSDGAKSDAKSDTAKTDGSKSEGTKTEGAKTDSAKTDGAKSDTAASGNKEGSSGSGSSSAANGSATGAKAPATSSSSAGTDKSPAAGAGTANAATTGSAARMPAAVAPNVPGKSDMFRPTDLAGSTGSVPIPVVGPALPVLPPPIPQTNIPACDFCNQTIQNGNSKLLINITHQ